MTSQRRPRSSRAELEAEHRLTSLENGQKQVLDTLTRIEDQVGSAIQQHLKEDDKRFSSIDNHNSSASHVLSKIELGQTSLLEKVTLVVTNYSILEGWRQMHSEYHKKREGFLSGVNWSAISLIALASAVGGIAAKVLTS